MLDNYPIIHGQFPIKHTTKYNIVKTKIKIRSDYLCIIEIVSLSLILMNNVWQIVSLQEDTLMNVRWNVDRTKQDLGI